MYLLDTNVISELRKRQRADAGVLRFFRRLAEQQAQAWLSVVTVGELRRGIELIRHRGDRAQAESLAVWLQIVLDEYDDNLLDFGKEEAQVWGCLRVPHPENALDKQIAATGVRLLNPFEPGY